MVRSRLLTPMRSAPEAMAAIEFGAVVDLDQRGHAVPRGGFAEIAEFAFGEDGGDQQNRVGPMRRGFDDLRGGDCKILAQRRKLDSGAGSFEIDELALEVRRIGEDGDRRGAAQLIGAGDARRVEIGGENAAAGGCFLDLGDDGRGLRAQGGAKIAAAGEAALRRRIPTRQAKPPPADTSSRLVATIRAKMSGTVSIKGVLSS